MDRDRRRAAEVLLRLTLPDPPTAADLGVRSSIYAALTVLVLGLRTGRNGVRWTLTLLLGGVGMLSLIIEPAGWLLAGGSPATSVPPAATPSGFPMLRGSWSPTQPGSCPSP